MRRKFLSAEENHEENRNDDAEETVWSYLIPVKLIPEIKLIFKIILKLIFDKNSDERIGFIIKRDCY